MSVSFLELARQAHEEIEILERALVKEINDKEPKTNKESLEQSHLVLSYVERIEEVHARLARYYADEDGSRRKESDALGGTGLTAFLTFYGRLKDIKDYHHRFPGIVFAEEPSKVLLEPPQPKYEFSGEEERGQYLDLHQLHDTYINILPSHIVFEPAGVKKSKSEVTLDYTTYVENFTLFNSMQWRQLPHPAYSEYLQQVIDYLISWIQRSEPLHETQPLLDALNADFTRKFASGEFRSWDSAAGAGASTSASSSAAPTTSTTSGPGSSTTTAPSAASSTSTSQGAVDLYCMPCGKNFAKETVFKSHLSGKKHITAVERLQKSSLSSSQSGSAGDKQHQYSSLYTEVLRRQYVVHELGELLQGPLQDTIVNIERKQSRTWDEIRDELEGEDKAVLTEEDLQVDAPKMSIDNYPVGWDGKPIPYWLYKLHGLGIKYECEICGNQAYWGRRAFERHFQEWRHAHGMACLQVPNTRHFHEITKIADATELWKKIKHDREVSEWRPEQEEECEDANGNVFNKKTFEDLRRQGILH